MTNAVRVFSRAFFFFATHGRPSKVEVTKNSALLGSRFSSKCWELNCDPWTVSVLSVRRLKGCFVEIRNEVEEQLRERGLRSFG